MKNKLYILIILSNILFASQWMEYQSHLISNNSLVIKLDENISPKLGIEDPITIESDFQFLDKLVKLGVSNVSPLFIDYKNFSSKQYEFSLHQYYEINFNRSFDFDEIYQLIISESDIINVEPIYRKKMNLEPNDQYYQDQWAHQNSGQAVSYGGSYVGTPDCDTDTNEAWDISTGNSSSTIAILDTGVSAHPEFTGRLIGGYNFISNNTNASDDQGHGTSCAGIAAAKGNNSSGIAGVCWDCLIMPVKVLDSSGYGDDNGIANGIQWSADNGADVISMSLGGGGYVSYTESVINYATEIGSVVIAASGNDNSGSLSYPSGYQNCISVGALSPCNERKSTSSCDGENFWGSNYGSGLDFLAPGVRIHTTTMSGGYTSTFNGTSSACPHAAGIAGLIRSESNNISAYDVRLLMQQSADDLGGVGYDVQTGYGRVNAYNSLFNLLYNPDAFVDIQSIDVEIVPETSIQEVFVIANLGESDLEFNIDADGYSWKSSNDENFDYLWIDISDESTLINFNHNDYASDQIMQLDFEFPFFNSSYANLIINPNGWVGFGEDNTGWDNTSLPNSSSPNPAIMGFWDDLNPINSNGTGQGNVYFNSNEERAVVWFDNVQHWPTNFEGSIYDFQIVIYATGDIFINYRSMQGITNSGTIGIQDASGVNGLLVNYNANFVEDQFSILINKMPTWLEASPLSGVVAPQEVSEIYLEFETTGLMAGQYAYDLQIETNDYENSNINIPITLNVLEDSCAGLSPGDINQDNQLNILDVTGLVNLALGLVNPEGCQNEVADINLDSAINILDILALVNLILRSN
ncbi:MAG: hypothetical protein CBD21_01630 [bacterium TMED161]|nr:hypothetical protein [Candidatus Neomarinimicrobiota bacterium]OUW21330.1 MAG: hypothetical protein CBD21_01630 [bacterium TMED161]|tara:strand:+ start:4813 stop:7236 length:2424 start_codon:yes stop_codon:yes gene_type:complete